MKSYTYFSADELACPCGQCDGGEMDEAFMARVIELHKDYGEPMPAESAYRCARHNKDVGGKPGSYHPKGRALDIRVKTEAQRYKLVALAIKHGFGGIGIARTTVHIDDRPAEIARMWHYYPARAGQPIKAATRLTLDDGFEPPAAKKCYDGVDWGMPMVIL